MFKDRPCLRIGHVHIKERSDVALNYIDRKINAECVSLGRGRGSYRRRRRKERRMVGEGAVLELPLQAVVGCFAWGAVELPGSRGCHLGWVQHLDRVWLFQQHGLRCHIGALAFRLRQWIDQWTHWPALLLHRYLLHQARVRYLYRIMERVQRVKKPN